MTDLGHAQAIGPLRHDVFVVGAGPSGTASAIRLAKLGFDVALLERAAFPRPHVGICISEQTLGLLEFLGLSDGFQAARFWRRGVTAVSWGSSGLRLVEQNGYHVDRGVLDSLLLDIARQVGVSVYQPAEVMQLLALEDGWLCDVAFEGRSQQIACRFLVDAAGRRSTLLGTRAKVGPPLLAVHAEWTLRRGGALDGLIESGPNGWIWYAQTQQERAVVSIFLDPRGAGFGNLLEVQYKRLLQQFTALQANTSLGACSRPRACNASSATSTDPIGARHIRIGDACLTIDPLSSQGVHLALQSGLQSAVIVNTILRMPERGELARQFYRERVSDRTARYRDRTRIEYARVADHSAHPFWQERAAGANHSDRRDPEPLFVNLAARPPLKATLAPGAVIASGPVIAGDFVEEGPRLFHPNVAGPIAFLAGENLPPLLARLPDQFAFDDIPHLWRDRLSEEKARIISHWLWQRGLLVDAA